MALPEFVSSAAVLGASAGISAALIFILKPLLSRHLLAHPNDRSSHHKATPEGAGLGVMAAIFIVLSVLLFGQFLPYPILAPVLIGAAALTLLGALDDAYSLPIVLRLLVQGGAAVLVAATLPPDFQILPQLLPLWVERTLLAIGILAFVNVINFLDGLDWMTVAQLVPMSLGIAALSWLGLLAHPIGFLALALLGATLGFAVFNKHPASIFLGDSGSLPIGLLLAFMLIWVAEAHIASALLLALYTLADSALTFFRRLLNGENVTSAHRSHFYQRAVAQGFKVPEVTTRVFIVCLWLAILAIASALAQSLLVDAITLLAGAAGVARVLTAFARGR
ncbi:MAG: glycosyl transferase [Pseudomonadota bacterium]